MIREIRTVICALLVCACITGCQATTQSTTSKTKTKEKYISESKITNALIEPDSYKGKRIKIEGEVSQGPDVDGNTGYLVRYVSANNRYFFVQTDGDLGYQEGDYIKVVGTINEQISMKNVYGDDIPVASIGDAKVSDGSYIDIVMPTYRTNKPNEKTQTIDGVSVTLSKVEYAQEETRVYLSIDNQSQGAIYYDPSYVILQQDNAIIYPDTGSASYELGDYPQLNYTISVGSKSNGILVFSVISSEKDCDLALTLYTSSYASMDFSIHVNA